MIEHTITIHGKDAGGGRPRPATVGPLLSLLEPTLRDNLRLAFYSSSRVKGRPHKALEKAWAIRLADMRGGPEESTELVFELPLLGEAAPQLYAQMELWDDAPQPEETALDLLGYTLTDIAANKASSNRFDLPLLNRVHRFNRIVKQGVTGVSLGGHCLSHGRAVPLVGRSFFDTVDRLVHDTPPARRARVHGKLDMVRCSDRVFELVTHSGDRMRAAWTPPDVAPLKEFLNHDVLIEGEAMFRPTGAVLRVDADAIRLARHGDDFFSQVPLPARVASKLKVAQHHSVAANGFTSIAGAWPGDESIDELMESLAELGR